MTLHNDPAKLDFSVSVYQSLCVDVHFLKLSLNAAHLVAEELFCIANLFVAFSLCREKTCFGKVRRHRKSVVDVMSITLVLYRLTDPLCCFQYVK